MPVTYLIWDAPLSSPHLAAAHTDSTLLHTSMTLTSPKEDDEGEKQRNEELEEGGRAKDGQEWFFLFYSLVAS